MQRLDGKAKVFRVLTCPACKVQFESTGPRAKFCPECSLFRQRCTAKLDSVHKRTGGRLRRAEHGCCNNPQLQVQILN